MADQSFAFTARRVLTAAGPDGSRALADGEPADVLVLNGCRLVRLWQTDAVPGALPVTTDVTAHGLGPMPKPFNGTRFYTAELPIGCRIPLHEAEQFDYIAVMKGQLTLVLESGETDLGPGDTVVQCGNMHGWENRGAEPCVIAVVAVAARTAAG